MTGAVGTSQSWAPLAQARPPTLVWGSAQWLWAAAAFAAVMLVLLAWGYRRAGASSGVRWLAAGLKALGVTVLAVCLLEPLFSGTRARPGANVFVVLTDNSRSMTLQDRGAPRSRGDEVMELTGDGSRWLARLGQDFDLRRYAFDAQLRAVEDGRPLPFDGPASNLGSSLSRLARRYHGRPLAGVLLFTDGGATDPDALEQLLARVTGGNKQSASAGAGDATAGERLPPVYPVVVGRDESADDVNLGHVSVSQTNFEDAPVTLVAQVTSSGFAGRQLGAELLDESGKVLERQTVRAEDDGKPATVRFQLKPEQPGVSFYRVRVTPEGAAKDAAATTSAPSTQPDSQPKVKTGGDGVEATRENNARLVAVDRGRGPYRVLYVCGRPNWEFKFLRRAVAADDQVHLVGLLRIARREPKFTFLGRRGEADDANPLFRGFDNRDKDQVEQYDQPVIVRLGTADENELRAGFPKTAEELYAYHAVVLDDIESEFFTQDQMQLVKDFVRQRGGGLLMLGGQETFKNGRYERTPIGDLLPVYADDGGTDPLPPDARFRLALTREGWLEPWVRLRDAEESERTRLSAMPEFHTLNRVRGIKPGATVLARAEVATPGGDVTPVPALVEQRYGQGRVGAMLIGDMWRWGLKRPENAEDDLAKAWRQTVRWLVADVPRRVELDAAAGRDSDSPEGTVKLSVRVRDPAYAPLDNATVSVNVTAPDGTSLDLTAEPAEKEAGLYEALYVPRQPGPYRARVTAAAPDGSDAGEANAGWASDPAADEFRDLRTNRALLDRVARATGGEVVTANKLDDLVDGLPSRHAQVTEPYVKPVWHTPWVFLFAITCLAAEWGLRRWKGLP
ncbi:MAG TPA: glutamine amidotransferase [Tepidisphaeraceae bacterium]|nr:glutamine amidotransferase [Tepidisphaeraceae bacterium]